MRNTQGWIKLWRKTSDTSIWNNNRPYIFKVAMYLLMHARFNDGTYSDKKGQEIPIKRGQLVVGREGGGKDCYINDHLFRSALKYLRTCGFLTSCLTTYGTLITICKYDSYQGNDNEVDQHIDQQLTSSSPAVDQQLTTKENGKNGKKERKEEVSISETLKINPSENSCNQVEEFNQDAQIEDLGVVEEKYENMTIVEKDKRRLLLMDLDTEEDLISYWDEILRTFGVVKSPDITGKGAQSEIYYSSLILKGLKTTKAGLAASIYDFLFKHHMNKTGKLKYLKKEGVSNVFTWIKTCYKYLVKEGIIDIVEEEQRNISNKNDYMNTIGQLEL